MGCLTKQRRLCSTQAQALPPHSSKQQTTETLQQACRDLGVYKHDQEQKLAWYTLRLSVSRQRPTRFGYRGGFLALNIPERGGRGCTAKAGTTPREFRCRWGRGGSRQRGRRRRSWWLKSTCKPISQRLTTDWSAFDTTGCDSLCFRLRVNCSLCTAHCMALEASFATARNSRFCTWVRPSGIGTCCSLQHGAALYFVLH